MLKKFFESKKFTYTGLFLVIGIHISIFTTILLSPLNLVILIISIIFEVFFIALFIALVARYESIKYHVVRDSMTLIYNWKYIKEAVSIEIEKSNRTKSRFAIINFDIDDFKKLNDEYGHYTGDKALLEIVDLVKSIIRPYDIFGRLGGEEFCIILPETDEKDVKIISERIRSEVENIRINRKIPITISLGVTLHHEGDDYYKLYKRVDDAMYLAKDRGRNRIIFDL